MVELRAVRNGFAFGMYSIDGSEHAQQVEMEKRSQPQRFALHRFIIVRGRDDIALDIDEVEEVVDVGDDVVHLGVDLVHGALVGTVESIERRHVVNPQNRGSGVKASQQIKVAVGEILGIKTRFPHFDIETRQCVLEAVFLGEEIVLLDRGFGLHIEPLSAGRKCACKPQKQYGAVKYLFHTVFVRRRD